jgi:hypothetical protein
MPLSSFESDYLTLKVGASSEHPSVARFIDLINSFPEGSARRLEIEARLLDLVSKLAASLAEEVRARGDLTLYDHD